MGWIVTFVAIRGNNNSGTHTVVWYPDEERARKEFDQFSTPYNGGPIRYTHVRMAKVHAEANCESTRYP